MLSVQGQRGSQAGQLRRVDADPKGRRAEKPEKTVLVFLCVLGLATAGKQSDNLFWCPSSKYDTVSSTSSEATLADLLLPMCNERRK